MQIKQSDTPAVPTLQQPLIRQQAVMLQGRQACQLQLETRHVSTATMETALLSILEITVMKTCASRYMLEQGDCARWVGLGV
jgi:hypothetical protein